MCRTSNSVTWCHKVDCVGRKRLHVVSCSHVLFRLVTNWDMTCTFVMIRLASWCKRSAAATARSWPICSSQYSGDRPSRRADSGAPIYSIIRGREGVSHIPDPNRLGYHGPHTKSCGTSIPACCSAPAVTAPVLVLLHSHRMVPPSLNPD